MQQINTRGGIAALLFVLAACDSAGDDSGAGAGAGGLAMGTAAVPAAGGAAMARSGMADNANAGASAAGSAGDAGTTDPNECDRACLLDWMQRYLDALIAHDPSKVAISPDVKMTDNGVAAKPGDELWQTGTEMVDGARLDYADPVGTERRGRA